jgi:hypothetical protein
MRSSFMASGTNPFGQKTHLTAGTLDKFGKAARRERSSRARTRTRIRRAAPLSAAGATPAWCRPVTGAWPEIEARLIELCPDGPAKYHEWNKAGAPAASQFFTPITEKEAA